MNIKNVKFASQIIDKSRAFHLVPTYLQEKFVLQNVETLFTKDAIGWMPWVEITIKHMSFQKANTYESQSHLQKHVIICDQWMAVQISFRRENQHIWNHIIFNKLELDSSSYSFCRSNFSFQITLF
jgi:hypothetical protein